MIAQPGGHRDSLYLSRLIHEQQVTVLHFVPSMLQAFLEAPELESLAKSLRHVICSGEALPGALQSRFYGRLGAKLHNLYGPTEAAVDVTHWTCLPEHGSAAVPIGRPVANTQIYILDGRLEPVPIGVAGELHIGGVQVARGYVNRPELTAEKFIRDPFSAQEHARLYKTGDLARFRADGAIEYLGRLDHQIKLRGFRIELGEIETVLLTHPQVREAVVLAREDTPGDKRLVAYVVWAEGGAASSSELREHLKQRLPEYMVPAAFVELEALPLTPNGKVDRKRLPAPERSLSDAERYVAPRSQLERKLAEIFADVLRVERVGIHDNFFALGGHSLLATRLVSAVRSTLDVDLPLRTVFQRPTVAELAQELTHLDQRARIPPLTKSERRNGRSSLSYAQQRLWVLDQLEPGSAAYNMPFAMRLRGELDVEALGKAVDELVRRHESLRTRFESVGGEPVQVVEPELKVPLELREVSSEGELHGYLKEGVNKPFELSRGPLLRVRVLRVSAREHVLLWVMHHIVSDGWSMGVVFRELSALYEGYREGREVQLPQLPVQYADYAVWQREWLSGEELQRQVRYWKEALAGAAPVLELPTDRVRPAVQSYRGTFHSRELPERLAGQLKELGRERGCTLFMVLMAAFDVLLSRWSGQEDVVVGTPIAGRQRSELEGLIGFFVNTLALRADVSGDPSFVDLLERVRQTALDAYGHQDLPFEKLVQELNPERDTSRSPIVQVMFSLNSEELLPRLRIGGLETAAESFGIETTAFDLSVQVLEAGGRLVTAYQYNTDLFDAETIERLAGHYERLLEQIVAAPERRITALSLLGDGERRQVLEEWNATAVEYPREAGITEVFESRVARSPRALAVVDAEQELSYEELNRRANGLAQRLRDLGVGSGSLVGLCMERSWRTVVGYSGDRQGGRGVRAARSELPGSAAKIHAAGRGR